MKTSPDVKEAEIIKYLRIGDVINIISGQVQVVPPADPRYQDLTTALLARDWDRARDVLDPVSALGLGPATLVGGRILYAGEMMPDDLVRQAIRMRGQTDGQSASKMTLIATLNVWLTLKKRGLETDAEHALRFFVDSEALPASDDGYHFLVREKKLSEWLARHGDGSLAWTKVSGIAIHAFSGDGGWFPGNVEEAALEFVIKKYFGPTLTKDVDLRRFLKSMKRWSLNEVTKNGGACTYSLSNIISLGTAVANSGVSGPDLCDTFCGQSRPSPSLTSPEAVGLAALLAAAPRRRKIFFLSLLVPAEEEPHKSQRAALLVSCSRLATVEDGARSTIAEAVARAEQANLAKLETFIDREVRKFHQKDFPLLQLNRHPALVNLSAKVAHLGAQVVIPESAHDLVDWGLDLGNCVGQGGYARKAAEGRSILLGVIVDGRREFMIEVNPETRALVQFSSHGNRAGKSESLGLVEEVKRVLVELELIAPPS